MAKKKDSKVSISNVDKILKCACSDMTEVHELSVGDASMSVEIKKVLEYSDFANMVNTASNAVFGLDENGAAVYNAEYEDVAKFMAILIYVANFKEEMSADRAYSLLYCTDLYSLISGVWSHGQHAAFDEAFEKNVQMRRDMMVANAESGLADLISKITAATDVMHSAASIMDGVDPETLYNALSVMSNMDEEKLTDNILQFRGTEDE